MSMMSAYMKLKPLLESEPPKGYIPGIGRGATPFTTRSDLGPSTDGHGSLRTESMTASDVVDNDKGDYSDTNFDKWGGFSQKLFGEGDADDEEADRIYEAHFRHMDGRRKDRREKAEKERIEKYNRENPNYSKQLADLKRGLSTVTDEEWEGIPDIGNYSIKRHKQDIWTPVPDSLIIQQMGPGHNTSISAATAGAATPIMSDRSAKLNSSLQEQAGGVGGQTVVDPAGFMTEMETMSTNCNIEDTARARTLLANMVRTNPTHGPSWVALAKVEEMSGKLADARAVISEGCEKCPHSSEVWEEAIRLSAPKEAKAIVRKAVGHNPDSVPLWLQAAELETEPSKKRLVFRKALEQVPNSVKLWKEAIEIEDYSNARTLLRRAVVCVNHIDLWVALARLETYNNAKVHLNDARRQNPTEPLIWILAGQLEEKEKNFDAVPRRISKGVEVLAEHTAREQWIEQAQQSESQGYLHTTQAIIFSAIEMDVDPDDKTRKNTFQQDAASCIAKGFFSTARSIFNYSLKQFPSKKSIWIQAAELESAHGTPQTTSEILKEAVEHCNTSEYLWQMYAKHTWKEENDVSGARDILARAFKNLPDSEAIWLAAVKLEASNDELQRAKVILKSARERTTSARIWLKSAMLERQLGNRKEERELLGEGVKKFPSFSKLWLMLLQWESWKLATTALVGPALEKRIREVRSLCTEAIKQNMNNIPTWLEVVRIEEETLKDTVRARALLEKGRERNPGSELLWEATVCLEIRNNKESIGSKHLSKALQECPKSGLLWALYISMEPYGSKSRKSAGISACKKTKSHYVTTSIARIFWSERSIDKARKWFKMTTAEHPDYGDGWAFYYRFEVQHGTEEQRAEVIKNCVSASPKYGHSWVLVTKDPKNATVAGCRLSTEEVLKAVCRELVVEDRHSR
eukprot:TRINITY_DN21990_c0_g1_i1.p1 TRINITY_DN21990_c0_g1~~TRINITY_DN21990_c0_g1_i1.p1  ORF type:complete len:927 (+),score=227.63 TRINITY_DN21990_c0_g1_i1:30-2783(+)